MVYRPRLLITLITVVVTGAGSSQVGAWQPEGIYQGFQRPETSGYRQQDWGYDTDIYLRTFRAAGQGSFSIPSSPAGCRMSEFRKR